MEGHVPDTSMQYALEDEAILQREHTDSTPPVVSAIRYVLLTQLIVAIFTLVPIIAKPLTMSYPKVHLIVSYNPINLEIPVLTVLFLWAIITGIGIHFLGNLEEWARRMSLTVEAAVLAVMAILVYGGISLALPTLVLSIVVIPLLMFHSTRDACILHRGIPLPDPTLAQYSIYSGYTPPPISTPHVEKMPFISLAGHRSDSDAKDTSQDSSRPSPASR